MKVYEIYDEEAGRTVGTLLYYDKEKSYIIELEENLDEWSAPLLFTGFVKKKIFTIPREISYIWVKERVIPAGRQNIGSILNTHKLKEYDEIKFLEISNGKCSQDALMIRKTDHLPKYVLQRQMQNLTEVIPLNGSRLLCFFRNDTIKIVDLMNHLEIKDISKVTSNKALYLSVKIGAGGYSAVFNDSIDISSKLLFEYGDSIPLSAGDFRTFVERNVIDTGESCELLECTRQNLAYMIGQNMVKPIKENLKGNIFLKGDIISNKW